VVVLRVACSRGAGQCGPAALSFGAPRVVRSLSEAWVGKHLQPAVFLKLRRWNRVYGDGADRVRDDRNPDSCRYMGRTFLRRVHDRSCGSAPQGQFVSLGTWRNTAFTALWAASRTENAGHRFVSCWWPSTRKTHPGKVLFPVHSRRLLQLRSCTLCRAAIDLGDRSMVNYMFWFCPGFGAE
jgi:hypothetical protein